MSILTDTTYTSTMLEHLVVGERRQLSHVMRFSSLPFCGRQYVYAMSGLDPMNGMGEYFTSVGTTAHTVLQNSARRRVEHSDKLDVVRDWKCMSCGSRYVFTPYRLSGLYEHGCPYCKAPSSQLKWDETTVRYKSSAGHVDDVYLHIESDGITVEVVDYKTCTSKAIYDHRKTGGVFPKYGNEFQLEGYTFLTKKIMSGFHEEFLRSEAGYVSHPYPGIGDKLILTLENYPKIKNITSSLIYVSRDNPMLSQRCEIGNVSNKKMALTMNKYVEDYELTRKILHSKQPAEKLPFYCRTPRDFEANPYCPLVKHCQGNVEKAMQHVTSALQLIRKS